jgi:four helix bundle protein
MKDYRRLEVWQLAHELTLAIYPLTDRFPKNEMFGLTSQIRRSSASIAANIAEGCGRTGNAELHRFLQIAAGSASELDYHLLLARDLKYVADQEYAVREAELNRLRRKLTALLSKVRQDRNAPGN